MKRRHTYTMLDVMLASTTDPMPADKRIYQSTHIEQALHAIQSSQNPDKGDWQLLSDAVNLSETLVQMGELNDDSGLLGVAVQSMARAAERHKRGHPIRLDGEGLAAVQSIVEAYTDAIRYLPHRVMLVCHRATETRIWDILNNKTQAHDVVVTTL